MAHPYNSSREAKVGKSRAKDFVKGYQSGGRAKEPPKMLLKGSTIPPTLTKDWDASEPPIGRAEALGKSSSYTGTYKKSGGKIEGRATGGRLDKFARGGKVKKKPETQINIAIVQPSGDSPTQAGSAATGGSGLPPLGGPPAAPPPPAAPAAPMGPMGPQGPAGPMVIAPQGGAGMRPPGMMKRGGAVKGFKRGGVVTGQKGGGDSGVGRLDKVKMAKRK